MIAAFALIETCGISSAAVTEDVRCLSTAGLKRVQLEWHTFADSSGDWFGGYVRYRNSSRIISIAWLEVMGGQVSGKYELSSQGANVYGFSYRGLRRPSTFFFTEVSSPDDDGTCRWE